MLDFYGLKDDVEGGFVFFFQATNEGTMKRVVKSALLGKEPNVFTTNLKDKSIYHLGKIDTDTGVVTPNTPIFVCGIQTLRLELIQEIKIAKTEAGEEKPEANEVCKDE